MITQVCNLSCQGCTNYSDLKHTGYVSWDQGKRWLEPWLDVLDIPDFGIIGGEPLINPEVYEWLRGVRTLMPASQIRFTTNALLWGKHPDLLTVLHDIGNVVLKITVHVEDQGIENTIKNIFDQYSWKPVKEYGINRWQTSNGLRFQINRPTAFVKTYIGQYENMMPYHSNPERAFDLCVQQSCPLLYQGRIYKCSTSGLLKDTLAKFNYPNLDQWKSYLESGISTNSTQTQIREFINNFGKPHAQCSQCPDKKEHYLINHLQTVTRK